MALGDSVENGASGTPGRIPEYLDLTPTIEALKRLEKQNFGLAPSRWIVHERHMDAAGKGVCLVLGVEEKTVAVLKAQNMQLYLGMGRASFRLLDAQPNKGTEDKTDVEKSAIQDGEYAPVHSN